MRRSSSADATRHSRAAGAARRQNFGFAGLDQQVVLAEADDPYVFQEADSWRISNDVSVWRAGLVRRVASGMKPLATRIAGSVVILSALGLSGVAVVLMLEEPGRVIGLVLVVLTYSSLILLAVELFARAVLRRSFATLVGQGTPSLRMEPHIFTHFIPSSDYPDIHDHFRRTSDGADSAEKTLYLAGDCVIFEDHLAPNQTMAYQLAAHLNGWRVLNAGAPHYTAAHAYSRLVFDVLRGYEAEVIVLFAGINDVLSFLHHDRGAVGPVYTHFYVPWVPYGGRRSGIRRLPSATLKLQPLLLPAEAPKCGAPSSNETLMTTGRQSTLRLVGSCSAPTRSLPPWPCSARLAKRWEHSLC